MAIAGGVDADADASGRLRSGSVVAWQPQQGQRSRDDGWQPRGSSGVARRERKLVIRGRAPQEVTSAWRRGGGVNLQPEVAPQQTEEPPRDSSGEDTLVGKSGEN
jgi:hypothetical protein